MTSKEALIEFYNRVTSDDIDKARYLGDAVKAIQEWLEKYYTIEKDLDRLEKLEKVIELLWYKNVNIVYLKIFKDFKKYSEYYTGYSSKDKLTNEEFDLLKEVLENGLQYFWSI